MAEIRWTEEAASWLERIHGYIAQSSAQAARRVVGEIYDKVQLLGQSPELGHLCRKEPEGDIRILVYGHYRIAYLQ